ncbi:MAG: tRNA (adenosine(37)-N6)-threonylcarbamoyltransferase complex ATPase subunit type 1 TsaE [Myxococcales bacterium]|nr:tRNA (adenosine(37)-N6)-threonylcarbamoyltransferase complex ATPase subunit type 1 TsaE [Myxococcales bacterium]
MISTVLRSDSAERTEWLGELLGALLEPGHVVGLVGDLGAGKTCFVRGVARGARVDNSATVASPTFTLINEYPGPVPLAHIDLYRLGDPDELYEIGALEYYGSEFACLVEWFDRFAEAQPRDELLEIALRVTGDTSRELALVARGGRHEALLARFIEQAEASS